MAALAPTPLSKHPLSSSPKQIFDSRVQSGEIQPTQFRFLASFRSNTGVRLKASAEPPALTRCDKPESLVEMESGCDLFDELKNRFLSFKSQKYMENSEHYQALSKGQAPKFMVIACADSRVCPSNILGFEPGEAFTVRNVANMVPTFESGPSETNAALEFAVNTLEVENILIVGHSCCSGIRALMSLQDEADSSFIRSWVIVGKNAKLSTKASASNLDFDQQCTHCEKASINNSLLNLLTYPWIEEKVKKGVLSLHGGYYDFVDCTFEKWTLDYKGSITDGKNRAVVKDRSFWC
ncbi:beta carbonic anhydrase 5, chloroplastic-like isoform X2 [Hibiscus syriacus]|uniref:beta carbonic anhydrase 5, chloroplastic-like isoform X2 n=1 Tax=Hibiscus syriacus TaxID=106335 RepID=UPI001923977D|nr:beta carbonic anhydrase 5, chloroplastic-like isoform X2 [Hibiscus syriacus]